ncbi:MAG TPA: YtxH domain-containing protein [Rhodothermales bacterium]|nr:YtxH domain-containing protein [Rhodothermales bacterium]
MRDDRSSTGTALMVLSAFIGGIGLGMLLAPRSGEEIRRTIGNEVRKQRELAARQARHLADETARKYVPLHDEDEAEWANIGKGLSKELSRL